VAVLCSCGALCDIGSDPLLPQFTCGTRIPGALLPGKNCGARAPMQRWKVLVPRIAWATCHDHADQTYVAAFLLLLSVAISPRCGSPTGSTADRHCFTVGEHNHMTLSYAPEREGPPFSA